jgi:hypothetical protein
MADYDVGVLGLSSPAAVAPLTVCRLVVSVRNNGLHDAIASGYVRVYSAGLQIFESEIYSDTLTPGATGPASSVSYWTPPAEGSYMVQGYISTPLDQVEPNNNLAPTTIQISGEAPTPPTPVTLHASQHEEGGGDELSIQGLSGTAATPQTPTAHKQSHMIAGDDVIDVTNLNGQLAEPQTAKNHALSHMFGGDDVLNVGGLHGVLADNQPAILHDNAKHDPNYATEAAVDDLYTSFEWHKDGTDPVHINAPNLEHNNEKGIANGYAGLDSQGHVPDGQLATVPDPIPDAAYALTIGSGWSKAYPKEHANLHEAGGDDELDVTGLSGVLVDSQPADVLNAAAAYTAVVDGDPETTIASLTVPLDWLNDSAGFIIDLFGRFKITSGFALFTLYFGGSSLNVIRLSTAGTGGKWSLHSAAPNLGSRQFKAGQSLLATTPSSPTPTVVVEPSSASVSVPDSENDLLIKVTLSGTTAGDYIYCDEGLIHNTGKLIPR